MPMKRLVCHALGGILSWGVHDVRWSCDNCSMKNFHTLTALLAASFAVSASAAGNALWQAEQSCIKYPTPSARTECEAKLKEGQLAFEKEIQKKKDDAKNVGDHRVDTKKNNDLCFKRESTGETVCPN